MDVCKCKVSLLHGGILNSRRAASPLVWLVEGEEGVVEFSVLPWYRVPSSWDFPGKILEADLPKNCCQTFEGRRTIRTQTSCVCVPLTRQHRTARLQWCREHHNWTEQDRACVLFSDESRFSLSSDCRRQLIWRESGTAYRPENIQENDRYPTCSIMVWAGIMINGHTRLHVVANGTMTGQRYIDEVLLTHVRLFRGAVGDKFVFMDDNATCHRTLAVQVCLDSEGIQRLVWPARSPDLIPIENVWDAMERQVAGRNYPPTNKNTLTRALTEEWDKLPQQQLNNVVQSREYIFDPPTYRSAAKSNMPQTTMKKGILIWGSH
ncbi:transposable element Tcb2 transposase [Trichonephila clavipes]|nr:transposable element Tcb2 transposase [Trichonephila clavipes]